MTYGETLDVATWIEEWRARVFVQMHCVTRAGPHGDDLICEGREVRAFVKRDAADPDRLRAIAIPRHQGDVFLIPHSEPNPETRR